VAKHAGRRGKGYEANARGNSEEGARVPSHSFLARRERDRRFGRDGPDFRVRGHPGAAGYDRQIALWRSAKYWYVLPLYASMLTAFAGVVAMSAAPLGFIWWLNEGYAVRKLAAERESLAAMSPADDTRAG
jgi:hypothetical protein